MGLITPEILYNINKESAYASGDAPIYNTFEETGSGHRQFLQEVCNRLNKLLFDSEMKEIINGKENT